MVYEQAIQVVREWAEMLAREGVWPGFRAYLESRAQGPKTPADQLLNAFITDAESWTAEKKRDFATWLFTELEAREVLERWRFAGQADFRILPLELQRRLLLSTLREWIAEGTRDARPRRWLGIYISSELLDEGEADAALEQSITYDTAPLLPRLVFARRLMDAAWKGARTLPESYTGDLDEGIEKLERAHSFIHFFEDEKVRVAMKNDADRYMEILTDYEEFLEEESGDFAAWCRAQGRDYPWAKPGFWRG